MTDEATMLAAYAAHGSNPTARLILADWYEERGDPRGPWLRDPDLGELMGPQAQSPVPTLIVKCFKKQKKAARLLVRAGRAAVPELLMALAEGSYDSRIALRAILNDIAAADAELAPLLSQLKSTDPREQRTGLQALSELGERGMSAVGPLLALLDDERLTIREATVRTLVKLGPAADAAILAVHTLAGMEDWGLDALLHEEAVRRGPESPAVRILTKDLFIVGGRSGESADQSLRQLGAAVFDRLLEDVVYTDQEDEAHFADILRQLPDADERLLAVARDPTRNEKTRRFAIDALVNCFSSYDDVRPAADRDWVIPHLIEWADDPAGDVGHAVMTNLRRFGERAAAAVPTLVRLLDRELAARRRGWDGDDATILALAAIGPAAAVAMDRIRPLVDRPSYRYAAEQFLLRFEPPIDRSAEIRSALQSPDPKAREEMWRQLQYDPKDLPDLIALFERGLADRVAAVRQKAAQAIFGDSMRNYEWQDQPGRPALVRKHLVHRDAHVRRILANGIGLGRGERVAWLPDLLARLTVEPKPDVRAALLHAIQRPYWEEGRHPAYASDTVRAVVKTALRDPKPDVRAAAVRVVQSNWVQPPAELLPALLRVAREDRREAGYQAIELLMKVAAVRSRFIAILRARGAIHRLDELGYRPTRAERPKLLRTLRQPSSHTAFVAANLLGRCGKAAVSDLIPLLTVAEPEHVRTAAAVALKAIGPPARAAVPALLAVANDESAQNGGAGAAVAALRAVAAILPSAEVVERLRPSFRSQRLLVRKELIAIAKQLGPAARPWFTELLDLTRIEELDEQATLPTLLAEFVKKTPSLLARVMPLLDEPYLAVENALRVIALVGPHAAKAEPKLRALKADWEGPSGWLDQALKAVQDGPK